MLLVSANAAMSNHKRNPFFVIKHDTLLLTISFDAQHENAKRLQFSVLIRVGHFDCRFDRVWQLRLGRTCLKKFFNLKVKPNQRIQRKISNGTDQLTLVFHFWSPWWLLEMRFCLEYERFYVEYERIW